MPARTPAATRPPSVNSTMGTAMNDSTHMSTPRSHKKAGTRGSRSCANRRQRTAQESDGCDQAPGPEEGQPECPVRPTGSPHRAAERGAASAAEPRVRRPLPPAASARSSLFSHLSVTSEPDYARELFPRSPTSVLYQHTATSLDVQGNHTASRTGDMPSRDSLLDSRTITLRRRPCQNTIAV